MTQDHTQASPETLAQHITDAVNAPGERTQAMAAEKVSASVGEIISGLVNELAKQGGVHIDTLNVNIGQGR